MTDPRAEFHRLFFMNTSIAETARHYGLTAEEIGLALHYARLTKIVNTARGERRPVQLTPPHPIEITDGKRWCDQCERRVFPTEATTCSSQFCKAKIAANRNPSFAASTGPAACISTPGRSISS